MAVYVTFTASNDSTPYQGKGGRVLEGLIPFSVLLHGSLVRVYEYAGGQALTSRTFLALLKLLLVPNKLVMYAM